MTLPVSLGPPAGSPTVAAAAAAPCVSSTRSSNGTLASGEARTIAPPSRPTRLPETTVSSILRMETTGPAAGLLAGLVAGPAPRRNRRDKGTRRQGDKGKRHGPVFITLSPCPLV